MIAALKELARHHELLMMISWREVSIKYKQSVMGLLWAVLMPMLIVGAGMMVKFAFSMISGVPVSPAELARVTVKALPWAFFVSSIRFATNSLTSNSSLVTKIYFPREIFPISAVLSQLVDFAVALVLLAVVLVYSQVGVSMHLLWAPLLLTMLFVTTLGLALFLSAANLFFRDVKYLVEVFVTFAIFVTPVFFETSMFGSWGRLMLLNPVAPILEGLDAAIIGHRAPDAGWILYSAAASLVFLIGSYAFFKKVEPRFAESI